MSTCIFCFGVACVCAVIIGWVIGNPEGFYNPIVAGFGCVIGLILVGVIMFTTINIMDQKGAMVEDSHRYYIGAELYGETKNGTYLFIDENDNIWEWESDKKYTYDKVYLLSMDINDTYNTITDDILLMVWQEGGVNSQAMG